RRLEDVYHSDIYVVSAAGGPPRALVKRPGLDTLPKWSPDGRWITFVSNNGKPDWLENTVLCWAPASGGPPKVWSTKFDGHIAAHGSGEYEWHRRGPAVHFLADLGLGRQLFVLPEGGAGGVRIPSPLVQSAFSLSR